MPPATAIAHLKGGVGKTVLACNLAHALVAKLHRDGDTAARVLVADCDPQRGTTYLLAGNDVAPGIKATVATLMAGQTGLAETVIHLDDPAAGLDAYRAAAWAGIDLLPANPESRGIRVSAGTDFWALRDLLSGANLDLPHVRYVLLDCGYGDTDLTDLALVAGDGVLAVSTTAHMSVVNLGAMQDKIRLMQRSFPHVHLRGVIGNLYHAGWEADDANLADLRANLGEDLWEVLPARTVVEKAFDRQVPVVDLPDRSVPDITHPLGRIAARLIKETQS